jgi:hypothetical protein
MKRIICSMLAAVFVSFPSFALTYEIVGPCSEKPVYEGGVPASGMSAGKATLQILEKNRAPYRGTEAGIHSILNTPEGDEAIEVISDREMRAYGWCYEVDGTQPNVMPDQFRLKGSEHLKWFYAFSHYKNGQWLTYCEPAYTVKPKGLCR